ncbi:hypothetical protein [Thermus tengchongensis]|uniref:hypothetical protein n=1 Tax=Thermus tengchongensis TaxID=1214928 RepID=UPI00056ECA22|nr:hypothetical protein [Thermus tengchongensis]
MPSPEAHRTRALRDAGLAEGLAREAPEWAAVLLAHAAHHLLLGWTFARAGEDPFPESYEAAYRRMKQAGVPRRGRKIHRELTRLAWKARYLCPSEEEAKALYQQAQALWEELLGVLPPP